MNITLVGYITPNSPYDKDAGPFLKVNIASIPLPDPVALCDLSPAHD